MDFWTRTLWTIKSNELMKKLLVDKIMEVINSVMVIPPAIQELIKYKLKEL